MIPLKVYGYVAKSPAVRPMVILKGETTGEMVPVWVGPHELDMGDYNPQLKGVLFHGLTAQVLRELGFEPVACELKAVEGMQQFADLVFRTKTRGVEKRIRARADEALSLAQALRMPVFASSEFAEKSRQMNVTHLESSIHEDFASELEQSGQFFLM